MRVRVPKQNFIFSFHKWNNHKKKKRTHPVSEERWQQFNPNTTLRRHWTHSKLREHRIATVARARYRTENRVRDDLEIHKRPFCINKIDGRRREYSVIHSHARTHLSTNNSKLITKVTKNYSGGRNYRRTTIEHIRKLVKKKLSMRGAVTDAFRIGSNNSMNIC